MHGIPEAVGTAGQTILSYECRCRRQRLSQPAISQAKPSVLDVGVMKGQKSEYEAVDVDECYATWLIDLPDLVVVRYVLQFLNHFFEGKRPPTVCRFILLQKVTDMQCGVTVRHPFQLREVNLHLQQVIDHERVIPKYLALLAEDIPSGGLG